jgi:hypothetical protein
MLCDYSTSVWSILLGMIVTGAARSIVVKLAYQSGFEAPLTITLLYLTGQALSLLVYAIRKKIHGYDTLPNDVLVLSKQSHELVCSSDDDHHDHPQEDRPKVVELRTFHSNPNQPISKGSSHGLSIESEERIQWIHFIPWYAKPAIPAFFNLLNSGLRWASLTYIDASVAEMLISGLELTLSVVAARIFRGRRIGAARWLGVILVALGIIIIERANSSKHQSLKNDGGNSNNYNGGKEDAMIGVILIILQSFLSVLQDLAEEIFMQAASFPPTMMLGMEGSYGLVLGLIIYFTIGDKIGIEDTGLTMQLLREHPKLLWWMAALPFLFLVTGIFNIKATEVTSAMTRNVWKNLRTVLVWLVALLIFYIGGNTDYGESWFTPESFYILLGLLVMSAGIGVYYWYKEDRPKGPTYHDCTQEEREMETSFV